MYPLISVIIPVYNVEQYFDYCIQSVLSQDYTNLEIILVDDGSTDSSGQKCDIYAKQDHRVRVIHQINGGLSSARNTGLKEMTGEFFAFVDSDDYVRSDYISKMYSLMEADKSDIVVCSYKKVTGNEDFSMIRAADMNHISYSREDIKIEMISRKIPMYAHGKLYKKELVVFTQFPIRRHFEDVPTSWNVIKNIEKATYTDAKLYYYRQRPDSIVNMSFNSSRMDQLYFSEQVFEDIEEDTELKYSAGSRCFFAAADNYSFVTDDYPEDKRYLKKAIKKYRKYVLKDKRAEKSLKIMAFISLFGMGIVGLLGRSYKKKNLNRLLHEEKMSAKPTDEV